jgi:hypothetical protein
MNKLNLKLLSWETQPDFEKSKEERQQLTADFLFKNAHMQLKKTKEA